MNAKRRIRSVMTPTAAHLFAATLTLLVAQAPALAQTSGPIVYEDYGRCEAAFPGEAITSAAITPFSCELTCGVDGVEQVVQVNDCKAQRVYQKNTYTTGPSATALLNLEFQSVLDVLDEHELPQDDMDKIRRVMSYARGSVRAHIYATVVDIAALDPELRTADEQAIAEVYANELHRMRIEAAQFSVDEFHRWEDTGCDYVPPEGFTYDANFSVCDGIWTFNDLFLNIQPPSFDEFVQYGVAHNLNELKEGNASIATSDAAHASQFIAVAIAAGVAIVGTFAAAVTVVAAAGAIFPFIGFGATIAAATETMLAALGATGTAVSAAVTGGVATAAIACAAGIVAVVAVIIAIFAGVLQAYYVFSADQLPQRLDEYLAQAKEQPPALADVVEEEPQNHELFIAMMRSTLPSLFDLNGSSPPALEWFAPIPNTLGRSMVVTRLDPATYAPIAGSETIVQSFQYMPWHDDTLTADDSIFGNWSAQVSGGWFVLSRPIAEQTASVMRLAIDRRGGDDADWVTWIVGTQFLSYPRNGQPEDGVLSDAMFFLTPEGEPRLLSFASDPTPPEVTANIDGTLGQNDWYVSDVTLQWQINEPDSLLSGTDGCKDATITADGVQDFSCAAASDGGATAKSVTVKRDAHPPSLSVEVVPQPNAAGWTNEPTKVATVCGDFGPSGGPSELIDCSGGLDSQLAVTGTLEDGLTRKITVSDLAGNSASKTVTLKVDMTAPTISASSDASPNALGWNNRDVTVSFLCEDALSGIETCPAPGVLDEDGVNLSLAGTAIDVAGNSATASVGGIKIDKTPPQIQPLPEPSANGFGWNNGPVEVTFLCSDPNPVPLNASGVKSCSGPATLADEGAGQMVEGRAVDNADNESTASHTVNIDLTPPTISGTATPTANANGWNNALVVVSFHCDDALSGIPKVTGCTPPGALGEGENQSVAGVATDRAGNQASTTFGPVNVDMTAPVVTIANPPATVPAYLQHQVVPADWSASDALSGLDQVDAPAAPGQPIDTSVAGDRRFEVSATDLAGNATTVGRDYVVLSPAEAIGNIQLAIEGLVADGVLKANQSKGLTQPLSNAIRSVEKDKFADACNQLADFIADVEAKSPVPIDAATATGLIGDAKAIASVSLACAVI